MIYARYLALVLADWLLALLGLIAVPLALAATPRQATRLPRWAWAWDNDIDGLDGDNGWRTQWCPDYQSRLCRFRWLAIRNRTTNFGRRIAGYTLSNQPRSQGDPWIGNGPGRPAGWTWITVPGEAFCFYWIWPWGRGRCVRVYLGWKMLPDRFDLLSGRYLWQTPARCSLVYNINPFARYGA